MYPLCIHTSCLTSGRKSNTSNRVFKRLSAP
nr:MAG TPA: hypothetical protein [Caudoviricetes sp.]